MTTAFKKGDFVRLPRSVPVDRDDHPGWSFGMDSLLGAVGEVTDDSGSAVRVNNWWWKYSWVEKITAREAHSITELGSWTRTEERLRERRDSHFRKIFGG